MKSNKDIKKIYHEIEYIVKSEIDIDNEDNEALINIYSSLDKEKNMVYNLDNNKSIKTEDDIIKILDRYGDEKKLNFICICDEFSSFFESIKKYIEIIKNNNKVRPTLIFYVLVFSFEDKIRINDLKDSYKKDRKIKINFFPFFLAMHHNQKEYSVKVHDNISNCIRISETRGDEQELKSELYAVDLQDLISLYNDYGDDLFKDNLRFHLDTPKYKSIDNNIEKTLESNPEMFWFYHNGITLLIKDKECINRDRIETITLKPNDNISIINGAQTLYTVSNYYFSLLEKEKNEKNEKEKIVNRIKNVKKAKVLLRIIINDTKDNWVNNNITIFLNSQKPVGEEDIKYFSKEIQAFNDELPRNKEIVRNGDPEDNYSINLIDFLKFYAVTFLQKPGMARSNKGKLLGDERLWNSLSIEGKEETTEWCIKIFDTILDYKKKYEQLKTIEKEHKNEKKYEYLKYEKEFCLAYYFWQTSEYSNNKQKVDFTKDFNSFVKDFISILSKYEIKGESEYDSNYFKIDSNYIILRDKLDKYNTVKEEQNHITSDK